MADIVVSDAGPLIAFAKLERLALLSSLFEQVWVPTVVIEECCADLSLPGAAIIKVFLDQGGLRTALTKTESETTSPSLGPGERAAILLAKQKDCLLLIDDRVGRRVARHEGVRVVGTAGVLLRAKELGLVAELRPLLEALDAVGYHLSEALIAELLKRAGEAE